MNNAQVTEKPWWLLPNTRLHPAWWIPIGALLVILYYLAETLRDYPLVYAIPVMLAAWYSGRITSLMLALAVPLFQLAYIAATEGGPGTTSLLMMTVLRGAFIAVMGQWFARLSEHERRLHRYVVKLEGLLPICAFCKSIRNEADTWEPLEAFISSRSDADFSHGYCPDCVRTHYPFAS